MAAFPGLRKSQFRWARQSWDSLLSEVVSPPVPGNEWGVSTRSRGWPGCSPPGLSIGCVVAGFLLCVPHHLDVVSSGRLETI